MNTSTFNSNTAPALCVPPPPIEAQTVTAEPTLKTGCDTTWLVTRALCRTMEQQREQKAIEATQAEINAASFDPHEIEKPSMAGARKQWLKGQSGPEFVPFEIEGETLFVKQFNFGETLYLALLMPLDSSGLLSNTAPEKLAFLAAEVLRIALRRDESGTPFFETNIAACHYVDSVETCVFAATCIEAIQRVTGIFPQNPDRVETPKSEAKQRLEKRRTQGKTKPNTITPQAILERTIRPTKQERYQP